MDRSRPSYRRLHPAVDLLLFWALLAGCAAPAVPPGTVAPAPAASTEAAPEPTAASSHPSPTAAAPPITATARPDGPAPTRRPERVYISQPGDTFNAIAARFGGYPLDFRCLSTVEGFCPPSGAGQEAGLGFDPGRLLPIGTPLVIPEHLDVHGQPELLLPDSEVIFSRAASDFDTAAYLDGTGGFLEDHRQYLMLNAWNTAADVIDLVAIENSANPRLLLALLEYQCGCVLGPADTPEPFLGADFIYRSDLYGQLIWAVHELSNGYYGWRLGTLTEVVLQDGAVVRLNPRLNAGTAALYRVFSFLNDTAGFRTALDPETGFPATFQAMFGDPWDRELVIIPDGAAQPPLQLPFEPGQVWSFTGGPHAAYEKNGPAAALDFAPASAEPGCLPTPAWVAAVASGLVVRSQYGVVMQDLDGDGDESTGWVIMYLHVGAEGRVAVGDYVVNGQRIGQPSCEGGRALGTHLHIARKLNGEWIPAGAGPLPFDLDGWVAADGSEVYEGTLERDGTVLIACVCSWRIGWISDE